MTKTLFKVKYAPKANSDLRHIWQTIAEHDRDAANRVFDGLNLRASRLSEFPFRGVARSDLGDGARILIERSYIILYRVTEHQVEVIRIVHGAMDLTKLVS